MGAALRQIDFEGLKDDGDAVLDLPDLLLLVGCEELFGFTNLDGADVDGGQVHDTPLCGGEHDGNAGITLFNEIAVLRLIGLFVGSDCPGTKVVDLLVFAVFDGTGIAAALGLEDANGLALAFDGAALIIDGFDVLVVEDDSSGVFGVVRGVGFGGIEPPLGDGLALLEPACGKGNAGEDEKSRKRDAEMTREHDQFPFATTGARVRTICC